MQVHADIAKCITPNLHSALCGPLSVMAINYIKDKAGMELDSNKPVATLAKLLQQPNNLAKLRKTEQTFTEEMQELNVDIHSPNRAEVKRKSSSSEQKPQILISMLFLLAYFLLLAAIFYVEISDDINMQKGENSLMDELQILFGVLTAGVGQILSYWFGGFFSKK